MFFNKILLLVAVVFTLLQAQNKVVMYDFEAIGVDSITAQTSSRLLRDYLRKSKVFTIVEPKPGVRCYTIADATENAKSLKAEKAVIGSISELGRKTIISYQLIDVNTGSVEFSDRATALSIEDLDITMERIGTAIETKKPFAGTTEIGKVTEAEKPTFKTRQPFGTIMFQTGYTFPFAHALPYDPGSMLFTIDGTVSYETPDLMTLALMGLRRGKQGFRDFHFDILVHKIFSRQDISPYIGGGVGVHKISFAPPDPLPKKSDDGFALSASGGVILFRTYYFRVLAGLRATAVFTEDLGTFTSTAFTFGITSPEVGPGGGIDAPSGCILGCLGAFFITGLIVALTS